MKPETLARSGFREIRPNVWFRCRMGRTRAVGACVWFVGGQALFAGASVDASDCRAVAAGRLAGQAHAGNVLEHLIHAVGDIECGMGWDEVGARWRSRWKRRRAKRRERRRDRRRERQAQRKVRRKKRRERRKKRWKAFKAKVNKIAKKIANSRVMKKIRGAFAKIIEGPVGNFVSNIGSKFLQAFGVPAPAAKFAIDQRRFAHAARLRAGGAAGMVARATDPNRKRGAMLKEIAKRNAAAAAKAAVSSLGGVLGVGKLGGKLLGKLGAKTTGSQLKALTTRMRGKGKLLRKIAKVGLPKKLSPRATKLLAGPGGSFALRSLQRTPKGRKVISLLAARAARNLAKQKRHEVAADFESVVLSRCRPHRSWAA